MSNGATARGLVVLIALSAAAGANVDAAPRAPADATAKKVAGEHYRKGVAFYKEENYAAALAEFTAAYDAHRSFEVLFNVGLCERRLFRYGRAIATLNRYLEEGGKKVPRERRASVALELEQIRSLVAPITVTTEPEAAALSVDGERAGVTPLKEPLVLGPGKHVLRATRDGSLPAERAIDVVSGAAQAVTLTLAPEVDTRPAIITIETLPPGATLTVDGAPAGTGPARVSLPPGSHEVFARAPGHLPTRTEVVVAPAQPRTVQVLLATAAPPPPPPQKLPVLGLSLSGIGVVAVGAGIAFAFVTAGIADEVSAFSKGGGTWDSSWAAKDANGKSYGLLGGGLLGVGGALLVAGLFVSAWTLYFGETPAATVVIAPALGEGGSVSCAVRF